MLGVLLALGWPVSGGASEVETYWRKGPEGWIRIEVAGDRVIRRSLLPVEPEEDLAFAGTPGREPPLDARRSRSWGRIAVTRTRLLGTGTLEPRLELECEVYGNPAARIAIDSIDLRGRRRELEVRPARHADHVRFRVPFDAGATPQVELRLYDARGTWIATERVTVRPDPLVRDPLGGDSSIPPGRR